MAAILTLPLLLSAAAAAAAAAPPTVQLPSGTYAGLTSTLPGTSLAYTAFLGLPFAGRTPRFAPPAPLQPAPAVAAARNATALPPACPQNGGMGASGSPVGESEDCLFVNVWTPDVKGRAPVMVWLFGGALQFGTASSPTYDGAQLAARNGVVLVGVNYRVSVLGFPGPAPGIAHAEQNLGFLDQRAALRWVQENIERLGGDKDKVTIFGESAGGRSVDFLLVAPEPGPPLFRAGVVQSGSAALSPGSLASGNASSAAATQQEPLLIRLARAVGCGGDGALACLRAAPVKTLMAAVKTHGLSFGATDDGGRTTARDAEGVRAARRAAGASLMIGTTAEELKGTLSGGKDRDAKLDEYVKRRFPGEAALQAKVAEAYRVGAAGRGGFATDFDAVAKLATDMEFTCVTSREAKSSAAAGYRTSSPSSLPPPLLFHVPQAD
jgi:carboxylesterase type B